MKLLHIYKRTKKWVLVSALVSTCLIGSIPKLASVPGLFETFLVASAILLLEFFLEIHTATVGQNDMPLEYYTGITEVIPNILQHIRDSNRPGGSKLQVLAISGSNVLPAIRTAVLESLKQRIITDVKIVVTLMEPTFTENIMQDTTTANKTRATYQDTMDFLSTYAKELQKANIQIELIMHEFTPIIHGFILNSEILYISTADRQPRFSGAHNAYYRLSVSQPLGRELIHALGIWSA